MSWKVMTALIGTILMTGCFYDVEEELYGTCNVGNVTYSGTITAILNNNSCLSCHSGPTPNGNVSLDTYTGVKAKVTDGRLFGAINHSNGYSPMPQGLSKMTQCDINRIKAWIDAGAPNN